MSSRIQVSLFCISFLILGFLAGPVSAQDLRLNEIQADNEQTLADDFDEYDDWLELYNPGSAPVDLMGLYLTDDADLVDLHQIPASLVVPAGGRLILWADGQPGQGPAHLSFRLSSGGEDLFLLAADGTTVLDQIAFPRQFPDHVYQRLPDGSGDWTWGRDPSPGLPNTEAHHEGFLLLNELMSINATVIADAAGDHDPWLEIANPLPIPVDLSGTLLRDAVGTEAELSGLIVPASGYQLLWLDGEPAEGPTHVASLLSAGGGALVFEATDGLATDSVIYPALGVDQAYARIPDGGDWEVTDMVTPGQTNPATLEPLLVINEFLASNENGIQDETGAAEDWVELYNPGSEAVSLLGLSLTDDLTDPEQWYFPDMVLEPGAFLVVWCDDDPEDGPLHATFKLSAGGEEIGLFMGEELLDNVVFGAQTTDISYGRRVDAGLPWITFTNPTPGASNGSGVGAPAMEIPTPRLAVPHPNPFNPRTSVDFYVPAADQVHLAVFDLRGRHVRTLVDGRLSAGRHSLIWCGDDAAGRALPSGVYCLRLHCGGQILSQRVTLAR